MRLRLRHEEMDSHSRTRLVLLDDICDLQRQTFSQWSRTIRVCSLLGGAACGPRPIFIGVWMFNAGCAHECS